MAPFFAQATAVVVPILTGAGIRVKIVEAMSAGRAIVSTSLGWEGLPHVEPGRHLLVADEPAAFAAATLRLLREPELRGRLAKDARALAETRVRLAGARRPPRGRAGVVIHVGAQPRRSSSPARPGAWRRYARELIPRARARTASG